MLDGKTRMEIVRAFLQGDSRVKISEDLQVNYRTVRRVVKDFRDGKIPMPHGATPTEERRRDIPPPPPPPNKIEAAPVEDLDPVRFRRVKLAEIGQDIGTARNLGRVQALAGLHRLHIEIHDQAVACVEARGDDISGMTTAEQERIIFSELANLPPAMRHRLLDHLEALDSGNVVTLPKGTSKRSKG
jgi:hypothetical protein|tara:strand:+ start:74 stop:634 length:561 start_codon:yes stop_codon:yes gene_type:complete